MCKCLRNNFDDCNYRISLNKYSRMDDRALLGIFCFVNFIKINPSLIDLQLRDPLHIKIL